MKNMLKIGIGVLLFLLLGFVSWKIFIAPIDSEALTVEEANDIATERFNGDILDTKLVNDVYHMTIKLDTGEYELKIASKSGEMIDVVQTKEETPEKELAKDDNKKSSENNKQSKEPKKSNEEETKKEKEKEPPKNISSDEAIQIALDTVYGEVDDVDLETENGQLYYFIEIETSDDLEAEIQIHAITGEVISIEWDD